MPAERPPAEWHYLDHAASTPVHPDAAAVLAARLADTYANPSGAHALARQARDRLDEAREALAAVVGARPGEIVWTSGGTESDNLAVRGVLAAHGGTAVCTAIEHHAVLDPVLAAGGTTLAVDRRGRVDLDHLAAALTPDVRLVSIGLVNNEVGVVQDLAAVRAVMAERAPGALLHTDAAQALTWLDVADQAAPADLVTLAAHKCGGPRGIGALVVRDGVRIAAQQVGGGQERDRRSGTPDVASAAAFAVAAAGAAARRDELARRVARWRDRLASAVLAEVDGAVESAAPDGDRAHVVPGIVNVCLPDVDSEAALFLLEHDHRVLASAASSCASGAQQRSHVLTALGLPDHLVAGSLRLSMGWTTTEEDVAAAEAAVPAVARHVRARSGSPA